MIDKTFATDGLPPIAEDPGGTPSKASLNTNHAEATLIERPVNSIQNLALRGGTAIWGKYKNRNEPFLWSSESDIQQLVKDVIEDAIAAAGVAREVVCQNELSVFQLRPDIWILLNRGNTFVHMKITVEGKMPIGIVEVKKPDEDVMNHRLLHGQILDYLLRLKSFYGLQDVFGIASTYKQWRFYWLSDCDAAAASQVVSANIVDVTHDDEQVADPDATLSDDEDKVDEVAFLR